VVHPVSVMVDTKGTAVVPEDKIARAVTQVFDLTPDGIMETLNLRRPIYQLTSAYGHFGRSAPEFTWERVDKGDELRKACGLKASKAAKVKGKTKNGAVASG
jgi:S-adenosylmethionine synthetase